MHDKAALTAAADPRKARMRRWLRLGLETHVSFPLFALVLVVATWVGTLQLVEAERAAAVEAARGSAGELIDTYEAQLARNLYGIDQTLKVMRYAVELHGARKAIGTLDQQGLLPPSLVFSVAIANRDGDIVASNPQGRAQNVAETDYFRYHRDGSADLPFVGRTTRNPGSDEARLHFTRKITDANGAFAGVAVVEVDPAYFVSGYELSRLGRRGLLGLFGEDGIYRARRSGDDIGAGMPAPQANGAGELQVGLDGVERFINIRKLHGFPLHAVAGLSQAEELEGFEQTRRNYLLAAAGITAALAIIVALVCLWSWQAGRTRRRIRRAQERYAAASEASLDAFFVMRSVTGADGRIVDFVVDATNSRAEAMTGFDKSEMIGKRLLDLLPQAAGSPLFEDLVHAATVGGLHEAERKVPYDSIHAAWVHRQVVAVEGGIVCIVRDITERKRAEERILHMAQHDTLTGLPNRSFIAERLQEAIDASRQHGNAVAVAFIDLDGFKLVNDGLGHNAGDELLRIVSSRMQKCIGIDATLGRFGGDEFVLVQPRLAHETAAIAPLLERLRESVAQPVLLDGQAVRVSASIGAVMYPRDGMDAGTLMQNADAAMYRAKELGSNNVQFYTREMNACGEQKLALLDGLRGALEAGQFRLEYQPKLDLRTCRIVGVEALLRWHHPEHGEVSPARFIPLAEESGLIVPIGEWVLQAACAQSRAWRDAGLAPITMSVNVSARQFEETHLVERVAKALQQAALDPAGLEIEVTESLIMRDMQQAIGRMRELKAMGVSLSVDDFGTGYSSLSALKSFPIASLKIDKSFVRDLANNPDDQAIALAVVSLAHRLHLRVVAEGVETEQQYRFLRDNDCDEMQGYLFSRPVGPAELAKLLAGDAAPAPARPRADMAVRAGS